jgi:hypothetical protein
MEAKLPEWFTQHVALFVICAAGLLLLAGF